MLMSFLGLFFLTLLLSQLCKFLFRKEWLKERFFDEFVWVFIYGSGPPSSHTAVLTASLVFVGETSGYNTTVFISLLVSSLFWIYEMYMQRLRFYTISRLVYDDHKHNREVIRHWLKREGKNIVEATRNFLVKFTTKNKQNRRRLVYEWKDLAGHDFMDLIWGFLLGLSVSMSYLQILSWLSFR